MKRIISLIMSLSIILSLTSCDFGDYKNAVNLYKDGNISNALSIFEELNDYKDSASYVIKCKLALCENSLEEANYQQVIEMLDPILQQELELMQQEPEASSALEASDFKKVVYYLTHAIFDDAQNKAVNGNYSAAIIDLNSALSYTNLVSNMYDESNLIQDAINALTFMYGQQLFNEKEFELAEVQFSSCESTNELATTYMKDCLYYNGCHQLNLGNPYEAMRYFEQLQNYKRSNLLLKMSREEILTGSWKLVNGTGKYSNIIDINLKYANSVLDYELINRMTGQSGTGSWELYLSNTRSGQDLYVGESKLRNTTITYILSENEFEWIDSSNELMGKYERVGEYQPTLKYDLDYATMDIEEYIPLSWEYQYQE